MFRRKGTKDPKPQHGGSSSYCCGRLRCHSLVLLMLVVGALLAVHYQSTAMQPLELQKKVDNNNKTKQNKKSKNAVKNKKSPKQDLDLFSHRPQPLGQKPASDSPPANKLLLSQTAVTSAQNRDQAVRDREALLQKAQEQTQKMRQRQQERVQFISKEQAQQKLQQQQQAQQAPRGQEQEEEEDSNKENDSNDNNNNSEDNDKANESNNNSNDVENNNENDNDNASNSKKDNGGEYDDSAEENALRMNDADNNNNSKNEENQSADDPAERQYAKEVEVALSRDEPEPEDPLLEGSTMNMNMNMNTNSLSRQESAEPAFNLTFSVEEPIFILSLPFSKDLVWPRYFECVNVQPGRYWTKMNPQWKKGRKPLGKCLLDNIQSETESIMQDCGKFKVWSDLQYVAPPKTKGKVKHEGQCFDAVLYQYPTVLEQMYQEYPQAKIITLQQDPEEWYKALPKDVKLFWKKYCNPTHDNAFPTSKSSKTQYLEFYQTYHEKIQQFIKDHKGWKHIKVKWTDDDEDTSKTARKLEKKLGVPEKCWLDATKPSMEQPRLPSQDGQPPTVAQVPHDIQYPIFVASLPKSGTTTTQSYFKCGLGDWAAAHQWTTPTASKVDHQVPDILIGKCLEDNLKKKQSFGGDKTKLLQGCGHARVWSDVGYLKSSLNNGTCHYPTMHGGLEAFAKDYPTGTILQVVRDPSDWVESATKWHGLLERWSKAQNCPGFPQSGSLPRTWEKWYLDHVERVREFAKDHPSLSYVEVPLGENTGELLNKIYGFHHACWGHSNINPLNE